MGAAADAPSWKAPGRATVSTFLVVRNAPDVIDFARTVFGAELAAPPLYRASGALWNAELRIGESTIMLGEAQDGFERPGFVYVQVQDVDATFAAALEAGGRPIMEPAPRFYGDRDGGVEDPSGNWWWIATHERDLTPAEIEAGAREQEAMT